MWEEGLNWCSPGKTNWSVIGFSDGQIANWVWIWKVHWNSWDSASRMETEIRHTEKQTHWQNTQQNGLHYHGAWWGLYSSLSLTLSYHYTFRITNRMSIIILLTHSLEVDVWFTPESMRYSIHFDLIPGTRKEVLQQHMGINCFPGHWLSCGWLQ